GYISNSDANSGIAGVHQKDNPRINVEDLLNELDNVKSQLALKEENRQRKQSLIEKIGKTLQKNDFSPEYINDLCNRLMDDEELVSKNDLLLLESKTLGFIADSIKIDTAAQKSIPKILVLMGPTGVGKTTTIAKIAAIHGFSHNSSHNKKVAIVTIDNYRIGARNQIETFGDIMSIPVTTVNSPLALDGFIKEHADSDLILIDTIGKSPKDQDIYDEMQRILSVCASNTKFCLTLSASMKSTDMIKTIDRFLSFRISSIILTKFDETEILGNIISVISRKQLPVLYITTGQKVPQDLIYASKGFFLRTLKGFAVDVDQLTFGEFGAEKPSIDPADNSIFDGDGQG
ncbi:MAG: hypothetical protein H8E61_01055, partial [Bacteroidetes bacterium]|nr:hypothetical protein [Bacteroidota bacterium]